MHNLDYIISQFENGNISKEEFKKQLLLYKTFDKLKSIKLDKDRENKIGLPEFIYGKNKDFKQIQNIISHYLSNNKPFLITKCEDFIIKNISEKYSNNKDILFNNKAKVIRFKKYNYKYSGSVCIITAGSSDENILEEAKETLIFLNVPHTVICDAGVAGIDRLLAYYNKIKEHNYIIAIAGMEASLPTLCASLFKSPVIAVPTSNGYGTHFNGTTALLSILNSCVPGITSVNIDNGFGAAFFVTKALLK